MDDFRQAIVDSNSGAPKFHLDGPEMDDGKPLVTQAPFTEGLYVYHSWRGDAVIDGVLVRGGGVALHLEWDGAETGEDLNKSAAITFLETVEMHDGHACWPLTNWSPGDEWKVFIRIPATPVTAGGGTGNCNLAAYQQLYPWDSGTTYAAGDLVTGGDGINYVCIQGHANQEPPNAAYWLHYLNVIVPADGDGDFQLDESDAVCVPAEDAGLWNYDHWNDDLEPGTPGEADWILFDFSVPDYHLVKPMHCGSPLGTWKLDAAYKVEPLYPRWQFGVSVDKAAGEAVTWFAGDYTGFRESTQ